jgi:2-keto-3-deoxy-L-rhamnonate aldolase RhmA
MLFIGPNDLACSMGNGSKNHMDCPEVQEAIEVIRVAAENAGKISGIFCVNAEQAAARFAQGFQFINIGGDSMFIFSHSKGVTTLDFLTELCCSSSFHFLVVAVLSWSTFPACLTRY